MKIYEFDAVIQKHEGIDAGFIEFPYDVQAEFGASGQVKVLAYFDGLEYRGSLAKMGHHCHCLGLTQKVRNTIGKHPGDVVHVVIQQDTAPRIVEIPEDLKKLMAEDKEITNFFDSLSYTHQKEYAEWINSAKKSETRAKRLEQVIALLKSKQKNLRG